MPNPKTSKRWKIPLKHARPAELERICDQLASALDDLEMNTIMMRRARAASIRVFNSDYNYEHAVHCTLRALTDRQIVVLFKFWDRPSRDRDKASIREFLRVVSDDAPTVADFAVREHWFETQDDQQKFRELQRRRLCNLCGMIKKTEIRYARLLSVLDQVRNQIVAHNLIRDLQVQFEAFEFNHFSIRTIRLGRCISSFFDGPLARRSIGISPVRRLAVDAFWTKIEADRSGWFR
jgi:hypothetical protein